MCLIVRIWATSDTGNAKIGSWSPAAATLEWDNEADEQRTRLSLHACELVRGWDRPSGWKLTRPNRQRLHADLSGIFQEVPGELVMTAFFEPESVVDRVTVTRADLLDRVLANRLANGVQYTVTE